jgi:outer membrane immunogenic protein
MKRTLIAGAAFASLLAATGAFAADLPVYSKAPAVAVVYDWTGFYLGTNLGYSWGSGRTNGTATGTRAAVTGVTTVLTPLGTLPVSGSANVNGVIGGGQFGYNWQRGSWLLGVETDLQGTTEHHTGDVCTVAGCPAGSRVFSREYNLNWFGTLRGRAGFLVTERTFFYATGGLAYGSFTGSSPDLPLTWNSLKAGWTVGAGVETALGNDWSLKFEYLYMDLGNLGTVNASNSTSSTAGATVTTVTNTYLFNTKFTDNIVRVGLNYRFGTKY